MLRLGRSLMHISNKELVFTTLISLAHNASRHNTISKINLVSSIYFQILTSTTTGLPNSQSKWQTKKNNYFCQQYRPALTNKTFNDLNYYDHIHHFFSTLNRVIGFCLELLKVIDPHTKQSYKSRKLIIKYFIFWIQSSFFVWVHTIWVKRVKFLDTNLSSNK